MHAARFNALFRTRWDRVVEFLKLHYVLSRRDEPYWRAQRDPETVPPRLADLVAAVARPAAVGLRFAARRRDLPRRELPICLLRDGRRRCRRACRRRRPAMRAQFDQVRQRTRGLLSALPPNRALLEPHAASASAEKAVQRDQPRCARQHDDHRDLRIRAGASAELGDAVMACLTVPSEFRRVQNEFPILFRRDLDSGQLLGAGAVRVREWREPVPRGRAAGTRATARWRCRIQPFLVGRRAEAKAAAGPYRPRPRAHRRRGRGGRAPVRRPRPADALPRSIIGRSRRARPGLSRQRATFSRRSSVTTCSSPSRSTSSFATARAPAGRLPSDRRGEAARARARRARRASFGRLSDADLHGAGLALQPVGAGRAQEPAGSAMADAAAFRRRPLRASPRSSSARAELDARLSSRRRRSSFADWSPTGRWSRRAWKAAAAARAYLLDHRRDRAFTVNIGEPGGGRPPVLRRSDGHEFPHRPRRPAGDFRRDRRQ